MGSVRLRYGPITFTTCGHQLPAAFGPPRTSDGVCPPCARKNTPRRPTPKPVASRPRERLTPPPNRYETTPRGVPFGTAAKLRSRRTPDHLFVCQACYRAFRTHGTPLPTHTACTERLTQRRKEFPTP